MTDLTYPDELGNGEYDVDRRMSKEKLNKVRTSEVYYILLFL